MFETPWALFCLSFAAVAFVLPLARRLALSAGFVDRPGGRKKHEDLVPPIGGLVVFPVFMTGAVLYGVDWAACGPLFFAILILLVTGALDDRSHVPAWVKFGLQSVAACLIVIGGGAQIVVMGDLFGFGPFGLNIFAIPFTIVAVVLLINAVNLMDGLDGLAGGKGFVVLGWLALSCVLAGADVAGTLALILILMGALGGFLLYNMRHPLRPRAIIFLGDSGSLALGLTLAWFSITLAEGVEPVVHPISVAWLLALPIFDACGQFARRVSQGRHPFDADHDHFHHHFIYAGFPAGQATAIILGLTCLSGFIGVAGIKAGLHPALLTYSWIALLFLHIYMSMRPHRFRRLVARLRRERADGA